MTAAVLTREELHGLVTPLRIPPLPEKVVSMGLDLSLTASGLAASDGWVQVCGRDGVTNLPVSEQVPTLNELVGSILHEVILRQPQIVVVEALDMAQSYGGQVERSVLWWKVIEALHFRGFLTATPTSAQVKMYATGNGGATKPRVVAAVREHWPMFDVGRNNNKADAAAMAALGAALVGQPLCDLPEQHTRVLPRVRYTTDPPSRVLKKQGRQ